MLDFLFCSNCNTAFDFYKTNYICNHCNFLNQLDLSKSNYYNYLSLTPSYNINTQSLESNYLSISVKVHPDSFINKSEAEKINSFSHSLYLNEAYNILKDSYKKLEYLYLLKTGKDILTEEDKNPNQINIEFFELNMQVAKESNQDELLKLQKILLKKQDSYMQDIEKNFIESNYQQVKINYIYLKYLNTLLNNLKNKLD